VHDEWFADEEKVRRAVGLLERPVVEYPNAREVSSPYFTTVIEFFFFDILLESWDAYFVYSFYNYVCLTFFCYIFLY
jgi:hypothetical protein